MASILEDIGSYFKTKALITDDGVDYFRDQIPDSPDKAVACFQYGGSSDTFGDASMLVAVQVNVREVTYSKARKLIYSLYNAVQVPADADSQIIQLTANRYALIETLQPPFKTELDEKNRTIFKFNMNVVTVRDTE